MNFLNKLKSFDYIIFGVAAICILVFLLTFLGLRGTSKKRIEALSPVEIDIFFKGVTINSGNSPFVEGDKTFITIRNVPYTKLEITKVRFDKKKMVVPKGGSYEIKDDITQPYQYDFLVTVQDNAKITEDGAVVGGNKIKIGLPVTLEGFDYRLNGIVSNITLPNNKSQE